MRRVILVYAAAAFAACAAQQTAPDYAATAGRFDQERAEIASPLGATTYRLNRNRLLDLPGGRTFPSRNDWATSSRYTRAERPGARAQSVVAAMGSSRSGSLFLTLPTRGLTGQHVVSFDGQGANDL
jgi:hypothetical protein